MDHASVMHGISWTEKMYDSRDKKYYRVIRDVLYENLENTRQMENNSSIFAVLDYSNTQLHNKHAHKLQTKQKNKGGESVQVRSLFQCLSFELSSSDHPFFLSSKTNNVMLDKKDNTPEGTNSGTQTDAELASLIKQNHLVSREPLFRRLEERDTKELIQGFIIEMDAKNRALRFIIEKGLFTEYGQYCANQTEGGQS
jgi:hypothetical protein